MNRSTPLSQAPRIPFRAERNQPSVTGLVVRGVLKAGCKPGGGEQP